MGEDPKVSERQPAHPNFSNQCSLWPSEKADSRSPDNFSEVYLNTAPATTYTSTSYLKEGYRRHWPRDVMLEVQWGDISMSELYRKGI